MTGDQRNTVRDHTEATDPAQWLRRCWRRDPGLWSKDPAVQEQISQRLGWLTAAAFTRAQLPELDRFVTQIRNAGVREVVLLGMGGSSLAPEVLAHCFGPQPGSPTLRVVDTTHPDAIAEITTHLPLAETLFIVSSKSGTTSETLALYRHFHSATGGRGEQFVAITDPGSPLQRLAEENRFRRVFLNPADIGGRYSALSLVGMLPAAVTGLDVAALLDTSERAAQECQQPPSPAWLLGQAMAQNALAGRDKLTLVLPPAVAALGGWIEQLVAESTGKQGVGIVAVADEPLAGPEYYAQDRLFVVLDGPGEPTPDAQHINTALAALEAAGHPVVRRRLPRLIDLGAEFFVWELATAVAGAVLGINPFDEPDVNSAKQRTRELLEDPPAGGAAIYENDALTVRGAMPAQTGLDAVLSQWLDQLRPGDYMGVLAYLPASAGAALDALRAALRQRTRTAISMALGPRYLHSSGQLHKGGANNGMFLVLTDQPHHDLDIPGQRHSFGALIQAQAAGDLAVLAERRRRVLHVHLHDRERGLAALRAAL